MKFLQKIENPLKRSFLLAIFYIALSVVVFSILALVVINVPENWLLRRDNSSELENWLLDRSSFPTNLVLVREHVSDNEDVAKSYSNPKETVKILESFGRQEGYSRYYVSRQRCNIAGVRAIYISVVKMKDSAGAQKYEEWIQQRESQSNHLQSVSVGEAGYRFTSLGPSLCSNSEQETLIELGFLRNNAIGTVRIVAEKGHNSDAELLKILLPLAQQYDQKLQTVTR